MSSPVASQESRRFIRPHVKESIALKASQVSHDLTGTIGAEGYKSKNYVVKISDKQEDPVYLSVTGKYSDGKHSLLVCNLVFSHPSYGVVVVSGPGSILSNAAVHNVNRTYKAIETVFPKNKIQMAINYVDAVLQNKNFLEQKEVVMKFQLKECHRKSMDQRMREIRVMAELDDSKLHEENIECFFRHLKIRLQELAKELAEMDMTTHDAGKKVKPYGWCIPVELFNDEWEMRKTAIVAKEQLDMFQYKVEEWTTNVFDVDYFIEASRFEKLNIWGVHFDMSDLIKVHPNQVPEPREYFMKNPDGSTTIFSFTVDVKAVETFIISLCEQILPHLKNLQHNIVNEDFITFHSMRECTWNQKPAQVLNSVTHLLLKKIVQEEVVDISTTFDKITNLCLVINEAPIEQDAPIVDAPLERDASVVDAPLERDAPIVDAPVERDAPIVDAPVERDAPIVDAPVERDASVVDLTVDQDAPIVDAPVEQDALIVDLTVEQDATMVDPTDERKQKKFKNYA
jgi:hypothetical protein